MPLCGASRPSSIAGCCGCVPRSLCRSGWCNVGYSCCRPRFGLAFAVTLLVMLLTSINYNLGLGYVLTFTLGGIGVASILHAFRTCFICKFMRPPAPVSMRVTSPVSLRISNDASRPRTALVVTAADSGSSQRIDIQARATIAWSHCPCLRAIAAGCSPGGLVSPLPTRWA